MSRSVHARSPVVAAVAFLFGIAECDEMPAAALVALLGDLGVAPATARQALVRMRVRGQLTSRRAGRSTHYALVGPFGTSVVRLRADRGQAPEWEGHFHALLHQVPEPRRAYRDRLRRVASLVGYAPMQPGVLISVTDRADQLAEVLADAPADGHVRRATLGMDRAEAAAVAAEAWELPALARDLAAHRDHLRAALAERHDPPPEAATLRRLAELSGAIYLDLLRDPVLPVALRPPDWPGDALRMAIGELAATYVPPAQAYVGEQFRRLWPTTVRTCPEGP